MRSPLLFISVAALLLGACPKQKTSPKESTPDKPKTGADKPTAKKAPKYPPLSAAPPQVARYRIKKQNWTDQDLAKWIAEKPKPERPMLLDLRENKLTHVAVEQLAKAKTKIGRVISLTLSQKPIGDKGARTIAATERFGALDLLYLADTKITAVGVRALLGDKSVVRISALHLNNNPLGDTGVVALATSTPLHEGVDHR
jgi:hypothetical protein